MQSWQSRNETELVHRSFARMDRSNAAVWFRGVRRETAKAYRERGREKERERERESEKQ